MVSPLNVPRARQTIGAELRCFKGKGNFVFVLTVVRELTGDFVVASITGEETGRL